MRGLEWEPAIVVKLGGSLANDAVLAKWLRELARNRSAHFVVVPGGGPFADAVRHAQSRWRFGDEVAHEMAIAAMDQFGRVLCAIESDSVPCSSLRQIEQAWHGGRLPVWLPGRWMGRDRELAKTWDVTSDTIAAWLAKRFHSNGLVLVKSCDVPAGAGDPAMLAAAGMVDSALPEFWSHCPLPLRVVNKGAWNQLTQIVTEMQSCPSH